MAPKMHHGNMLFKSRFLMIRNLISRDIRLNLWITCCFIFLCSSLMVLIMVKSGLLYCSFEQKWQWRGQNLLNNTQKKQSNSHRKQSSSYWSLILLDLCVVWECIRIFFLHFINSFFSFESMDGYCFAIFFHFSDFFLLYIAKAKADWETNKRHSGTCENQINYLSFECSPVAH